MNELALWTSIWVVAAGAFCSLAFKSREALRRLALFLSLPAAAAFIALYVPDQRLQQFDGILVTHRDDAAGLEQRHLDRLRQWGTTAKDTTYDDLHDNYGIARGKREAYGDVQNQLSDHYRIPPWLLWNLAFLATAPPLIIALFALIFPKNPQAIP